MRANINIKSIQTKNYLLWVSQMSLDRFFNVLLAAVHYHEQSFKKQAVEKLKYLFISNQ
jgi:hypothetical protein